MQLIHALADTGQDGPDAYAQCTCGIRIWADNKDDAWEAFQSHQWLKPGQYPR